MLEPNDSNSKLHSLHSHAPSIFLSLSQPYPPLYLSFSVCLSLLYFTTPASASLNACDGRAYILFYVCDKKMQKVSYFNVAFQNIHHCHCRKLKLVKKIQFLFCIGFLFLFTIPHTLRVNVEYCNWIEIISVTNFLWV